jgi:hypothetical protein
MSEITDFLEFVTTPKDAYVVLNKFGYHKGGEILKMLTNAGFVEKKDSMIRINKSGISKLRELKENAGKPPAKDPIITLLDDNPAPKQETTERNPVSAFFFWISEAFR